MTAYWHGRLSFLSMDEGLPIAYEVLEPGVPVYSSDGEQVGTVDHVVAAPQEDIFHGIVISASGGKKFVAADDVASLHERGADLRIDAAAIAALPDPHGAAPARRVREPGAKPSRWKELVDMVALRRPGRRDWTDEN
ncbi:MAG TPA: PRC-barrel domain-containing protein [Solirubrobacteraceae bacterium]|nr:PRC-barrel domain-containing protein [Solirubrobacteraceae bacterium]